jgi:serine/threonine-protein kinase Chk1
MISGKYPFYSATTDDTKYKFIIEKNFKSFWSAVDKDGIFSESCRELIEQMLMFDPNERITLADISNHEWLADQSLTSEDVRKHLEGKNQPKPKKQRTRGGLSTVDRDDLLIISEDKRAYHKDGREVALTCDATQKKIMDVLITE